MKIEMDEIVKVTKITTLGSIFFSFDILFRGVVQLQEQDDEDERIFGSLCSEVKSISFQVRGELFTRSTFSVKN